MTDELLHPMYLPFTEAELEQHFAPVAAAPDGQHVEYFEDSLQRWAEYTESTAARRGAPSVTRLARQIKKGERFWIENALMSPTQRRDAP